MRYLDLWKIKKLKYLQDFLYRHMNIVYSANSIAAITLIAKPREIKRLLAELCKIDNNIIAVRGSNGGYKCVCEDGSRTDIEKYFFSNL